MNSPDLGSVDGDEDQQVVRSTGWRCCGGMPRRWCCGAAPRSPASEMAGGGSARLPDQVAAAGRCGHAAGRPEIAGGVAASGGRWSGRRTQVGSQAAGGAGAAEVIAVVALAAALEEGRPVASRIRARSCPRKVTRNGKDFQSA